MGVEAYCEEFRNGPHVIHALARANVKSTEAETVDFIHETDHSWH